MFNPQYRLLLMLKCFPADVCICLGTQFISLIHVLKDLLPAHTWYGADVDAVGAGASLLNIRGWQPNIIGTDQQLIQYCSEINQFIWGEFICIDSKYSSKSTLNIELETEDLPFRPLSIEGALMEIRMFDTSYIEIYAEGETIITNLSNKFHNSELALRDQQTPNHHHPFPQKKTVYRYD